MLEMLGKMTWNQFIGWAAYSDVEPFGEERADVRAGIIASTVANVNIDPRKTKPFTPADFMPRYGGKSAAGGRSSRREPLTDPNQWAEIKRLAAAHA